MTNKNRTSNSFKTISQIQSETGREFWEIYNELLKSGLSQTEIAMKLNLKRPSDIASYLYQRNVKKSAQESPESDIRKKLNEHIINFDKRELEKYFPTLFNIEYRDFLYQKYIIDKQSHADIAQILGCSSRSIDRHMKSYDIKKSLSQVRQDAIAKGRINYGKILSKSRKSMKTSKSLSHSQEYVHVLVKEELSSLVIEEKLDHLEVVVGLNEWGILKDKEVDIPIVIINTKNNSFSKYSIEFHGIAWHDSNERKKSDNDKVNKLTKHGWKHFEIWYSENFSKMNDSVVMITKEIISDFS
ncbi:hypothetical protein NGI46_28090 [Peribacillus butanolivorans]|uniref:hypothetical protein n=1 Tax=Peribacillus butanolivorans TaxID=421767 RepID=UPI00207D4734|nr:hypothetical protein [Peribacillus butanolivorans]MCO0601165.1 hypothetical protein [Peribacillus butanolivorans]